MSMINNIQPTNFNGLTNYKQMTRPNLSMGCDKVSFCGMPSKTVLTHTRCPKDAEALAKLFFASSEHSMSKGATQVAKKSWFGRVCDKLSQKFQINLEKSVVKNDDMYINVIKDSEGKVVGGFSMVVEPEKFVSHVNYVVLAPELKGTKKGKQMLVEMAEKIVENTEKNNGFEVTWCVNDAGKAFDRMMSKIPHTKEKLPLLKCTEYSVFTDDLKKVIKDVKSK